MQISDPDDSILVDEKIVVEDSKKVKQIPLTITSHGVHEMCLKLRGEEDVIIFPLNLDYSWRDENHHSSIHLSQDSLHFTLTSR